MRALNFAPPLPADVKKTDETVAPLPETSVDVSLFREMADRCPLGLLVHRRHKPLYVNAAWADLFGYRVEEIMAGATFCDLAHEADRDRLLKYGIDRMEGLSPPDRYRFRGLHKDGRTIWLEQFVKVVTWRDEKAIMVVTVDVDSEERQTAQLRRQQKIMEQEALERSEALHESSRELHIHQSIVDQVSELMSVVDTDYRYRLVNRAYLDFFGLCQEQVVGRHVQDILGEELFSTCAKPMLESAFEGPQSVRKNPERS
jgi:PAS domain S-box-containing protein